MDAHVKAPPARLGRAHHERRGALRRAAATLGLDSPRVLRGRPAPCSAAWPTPKPGTEQPLHALLDRERDAVVRLAAEWGEVDLSHRKLAHRSSQLDLSARVRIHGAARAHRSGVHLHLPARGVREPRPARAWPAWAELVPGVIWLYDFTYFRASKWCAVAVLDVVSRY